MKLQLTARRSNRNSAWSKAPSDASTIASRQGFKEYDIEPFRITRASFLGRILNKLHLLSFVELIQFAVLFNYLILRFYLSRGGELFIQHPIPSIIYADLRRILSLSRLKHVGVRITLLVHDIGMLRGNSIAVGGKTDTEKEYAVFHVADRLIVHNERMKSWFLEQGFSEKSLSVLGIFDYLCSPHTQLYSCHPMSNPPRIAIAGGMAPGKSKFLESLGIITDVSWRLYGPDFDKARIQGATIEYCGSYPPDLIPSQLVDADFGLVWDGDSIETCSGATGQYLLYNNPHKLSLYVASGLPVIVWAKSAIADFVLRHRIGLAVLSLKDIGKAISNLSASEHAQMHKNINIIGKRLRQGDFLSQILSDSTLYFCSDKA